MIKQMKKLEENCKFSIFCRIFAPLEAKMMKNDKKIENSRNIAIFHFLENFCTTGSKNDEK